MTKETQQSREGLSLPAPAAFEDMPAIERARAARAAQGKAAELESAYAAIYADALAELKAGRGRGWSRSVAEELGTTPAAVDQAIRRRHLKETT